MTEFNITTTIDIDAPASKAWTLFGEGFGDWDQWAPGIDSSELEGALEQGAIRVNETASLGTVSQELVRFEPEDRALAYEMRSGIPPMFTTIRNDWVLEDLGSNRCRLSGDARFVLTEAAAPMREKVQGKMGMTLEVFAKAFKTRLQESVS